MESTGNKKRNCEIFQTIPEHVVSPGFPSYFHNQAAVSV